MPKNQIEKYPFVPKKIKIIYSHGFFLLSDLNTDKFKLMFL